MLKQELKIFFAALMFFSRIPCPKWVDHSPEYLNKATRYFPLIGWILGVFTFAFYFAANQIFNAEISVIISMISGILITGAFHEDGFADVCDGFGGGWTKHQILEIMKDSRVGAYGVIGVILIMLMKFYLLLQVVHTPISLVINTSFTLLILFIAAHAISRLAAASIVFTHAYVREDLNSKSKPIAQDFSWKEVVGSSLFGLSPIIFLSFYQYQILYTIIIVTATRYFLARYFQKWIGGYTGDCLGATQQVCEVVFYLSAIGIWKFI